MTDPVYAREVEGLISAYGFRLSYDVPVDKFLQVLHQDKKKRRGQVRFVLQEKQGRTLFREVDDTLVREVLQR